MSELGDDAPPIESFSIDGFRGLVDPAAGLARPEVAARRVVDPANAEETIHWGRNYLYGMLLEGAGGPVPVVVKLFRNQGLWRRLERRLRGSKAERSWAMARAMRARGVRTPEPILLLESVLPEGPSIFVTRRATDVVEARYLLRSLKASTFAADHPWIDPPSLARAIGASARRLHDAGFWHRDLSIGNLLIGRDAEGGLEVDLVDLNRARDLSRVSVSRRTRDLSRLRFWDGDLDDRFLEAYWGVDREELGWKRALYLVYRGLYQGRVEGKKRLRGLTRRLGAKLLLRKPYAHIPEAPPDAHMRDKSVWDELSDQPHQHASRSERLRVRVADSGAHLRALAVAGAAAPRVRRRYRELRRDLWSSAVEWPGVGVGVGPGSGGTEEVLAALADLGTDQVLLRLHPWEREWDAEVALARRLAERGTDLVFALPQVRELVRDPARWRSVVTQIGERLRPYGRRFQIGQAINRSKWGLWNYREYVDLVATASEALRPLGDVEIIGPGVIDFEPHALAAALNYPGMSRLDRVASLLYVDRRGAPENAQLGFDALGKAALFRAIAETAHAGASSYWITEFNWPLWEGPHSPAGRTVSVDEDRQASYLVRYCVPVLGSGMAERAYWWQLAARGYGLLDPRAEGTRRRPAFLALATLIGELAGTRCEGLARLAERAADGARVYRFRHPVKGEVLVAWSLGDPVELPLPRRTHRLVTRDGVESSERRASARLGPAPAYYWLEPPKSS